MTKHRAQRRAHALACSCRYESGRFDRAQVLALALAVTLALALTLSLASGLATLERRRTSSQTGA